MFVQTKSFFYELLPSPHCIRLTSKSLSGKIKIKKEKRKIKKDKMRTKKYHNNIVYISII